MGLFRSARGYSRYGGSLLGRRIRRFSFIGAGFLLMIAIFAGLVVWQYNFYHSTVATIHVKVKKTERVGNQNEKGSRYLVFTENEVFENTDNVFFWKFNSSDIYGQIEEGKEYTFKVTGQRNQQYSWYRNILYIESSQ